MKFPLLLTALLASSAIADEHVVKSGPFETKITLDATFIPQEVTVLQIEPKQWSRFKIESLVKHGTAVKKGDVLVSFDKEDYDEQLTEKEKNVSARKIALALAERELTDLELSTPRSLEGERLSFNRNKESLDYFIKTGRALQEEDARQSLANSKRGLSYVEEELKQLLKMYEEDGVTEETEEIILKRQRAAVERARFSLKKAEKSEKWALEKTIPRRAVDLQRSFDSALLSYETAKVNLPRTLKKKQLSVEKARRKDIEDDKKLAELKADAQFFTITAPSDGVIYYGEITDHSWSLGSTAKFLFKNGSVPAEKAIMTLVANDSPLTLHGAIPQSQRLQLKPDAKGTTKVEGLDDSAFPTTITNLAIAPNAGGKFHLEMKAELPAETSLVGGMKGKASLVTYRNENALTVPTAAVTTKDGKSTVRIKMADDNDQAREVKLGRRSDSMVEILEGLDIDQVVLIPEKKK